MQFFVVILLNRQRFDALCVNVAYNVAQFQQFNGDGTQPKNEQKTSNRKVTEVIFLSL